MTNLVYDDNGIKLFNGDSLAWLKTIADKSVDFTFTDPPYNAKKDYGDYKDDLPPEKYVEWMRDYTQECIRVSKNGVGFYVGANLRELFSALLPGSKLIIVKKAGFHKPQGWYFMQYQCLFVTRNPNKHISDLWEDSVMPGEGAGYRQGRYSSHPGQTGLSMTQKVLTYFTEQGETVIDPFSGTGTTLFAAQILKRNAMACELNLNYCNDSIMRLAQKGM